MPKLSKPSQIVLALLAADLILVGVILLLLAHGYRLPFP
jgi:hypothetical protein